MDSQFQNQSVWQAHYSKEKSKQLYPDENVVRYFVHLLRQQPTNLPLTVLDLGTGSGRHLQFLKTLPVKSYGCDYALEAIKNHHDCVQTLAQVLSFKSHSFDIILCWGVLHYLNDNNIPLMLDEIYRVLKPKGRLFTTLRADRDTHLKQATLSGDLKGGKVKLFTKQEALDLFQNWAARQYGFICRQPLGQEHVVAHHIIEAVK